MGEERITVTSNGATWSAFERVQVSASVSEAARACRIEIAFEPGAAATAAAFRAGAEIEVRANGAPLFKGYVDRYQPRIDATSAAVAIDARGKGQDAIDAAALHKTGRFEKKTLLQIAQELDKAKIGFSADVDLDPIEKAQIRPGETLFAFLERYARPAHLTLMGDEAGGIRFWSAKKPARQAGALEEGRTILRGEAEHDWSGRHSAYVVRGQRAVGTGIDALEIEAVARDQSVERWRPTVIVVEEDLDSKKAKRRAEAHRDRAAGRGLKARVTVQGFRDEAGQVWSPGRLVPVHSPALAIAQDMLIESVEFTQDAEGSLAILSLVDPRAYAGKAGRGGSSGAAWSQGDKPAEETPPGQPSPLEQD